MRRSDSKPVTANWPAIITKEQHEELVAILGPQRRQRPGGQASRRVYLLGGLAVCGRCGHRLTGKPSFGKRRYYYCDPKLGGCGGLLRVAEALEDYAVSRLCCWSFLSALEAARRAPGEWRAWGGC